MGRQQIKSFLDMSKEKKKRRTYIRTSYMLRIPPRLALPVLLGQRDLALDPTQGRLLDIPATVLGQNLLVRQFVLGPVLAVATLRTDELLHQIALDGPSVALGGVGYACAADGHEARHVLSGWERRTGDGRGGYGCGGGHVERAAEGLRGLSLGCGLAAGGTQGLMSRD